METRDLNNDLTAKLCVVVSAFVTQKNLLLLNRERFTLEGTLFPFVRTQLCYQNKERRKR